MKNKNTMRVLAAGLMGCALYGLSFWLYPRIGDNAQLRIAVPPSRLAAEAEAAYHASPLGKYGFRRKISSSVNTKLLKYLQSAGKNAEISHFPIISTEFAWQGKVAGAGGKKRSVRFALRYDARGRPLGFDITPADSSTAPAAFSEVQALSRVYDFFADRRIDTTGYRLTQKQVADGQQRKFNFTFTRKDAAVPQVESTMAIEFDGTDVSKFTLDHHLEAGVAERFREDSAAEIVHIALMALLWMSISLFAIVKFFRKLRADELDLGHAFYAALITLVIYVLQAVAESWGDWLQMVLGSIMGGLFIGLAVFVLFALSEAIYRENFQEKLPGLDAILGGHLRVREIGAAGLQALWGAGAGLFLLVLGSALLEAGGIGSLGLSPNSLDRLWNPLAFAGSVFSFAIVALTGGLLLFGIILPSVRQKFHSGPTSLFINGLILSFTAFELLQVEPLYAAALGSLPVALYWAHFARKADFVALPLAVTLFLFYHDTLALGLTPDAGQSLRLIAIGLGMALYFGAAVWLFLAGKPSEEFERYVPEYISRIAERERFLKELEIARTVQMKFLPLKTPSFPGLEITSYCRPAMEVGGDYFDFVTNGRHQLGIVIGDVSGKGVSAAFYMTMAKGIFKTVARRSTRPTDILKELNSVFYENATREVFISVIYGFFDMQTRQLTFARAGHNPLLVHKRKAKNPQLLNPKGMAIGLAPESVFSKNLEENCITFEPGDVFVFYTDGLSESMDEAGQEYGEDRLQQLIQENADRDAETLRDIIIEEVQKFVGQSKQHDDFTMVVVRIAS